MTIFTTRNRRYQRRGFTLIEIMLVVGLTAILAVVAVPSIEGWLTERRLSTEADQLIGLVQAAKLRADETSEAQLVVLLPPGQKETRETEPNTTYLRAGDDVEWSLLCPGVRGEPVKTTEIHIDAHGLVEPVTFRVSSGEKYIEYRFDFLTGHALEVGGSL